MSAMWLAVVVTATLVVQAPARLPVQDAVWEAVQPALPFPAATERNEPVDGSATPRWVVRRGDAEQVPLVAEVMANPLNREVQQTAVQDMAAIQREVFAAERRAQAEVERAIDDVRATGKSVSVRGISLNDEGVAGDRADAESRLSIEVMTDAKQHTASVVSVEAPTFITTVRGPAWVVRVPARAVELSAASDDVRAHYYAAEALVYFDTVRPVLIESPAHTFAVRAEPRAGATAVVVVLRGNSQLVEQVLAKADWSRITAPRP